MLIYIYTWLLLLFFVVTGFFFCVVNGNCGACAECQGPFESNWARRVNGILNVLKWEKENWIMLRPILWNQVQNHLKLKKLIWGNEFFCVSLGETFKCICFWSFFLIGDIFTCDINLDNLYQGILISLFDFYVMLVHVCVVCLTVLLLQFRPGHSFKIDLWSQLDTS